MTDTILGGSLGGAHPNHNLVLMINLIPKAPLGVGDNRTLQAMYVEILNRAFTSPILPLGGAAQIAAVAAGSWRWAPTTIAFPLLGCRENYGYVNCAEQALAAITSWFNEPNPDPANPAAGPLGVQRRAQIVRIDLVIPTSEKSESNKIEQAWRRAWG